MILFLSAILTFVWQKGSVSDPSDRPPLGDRAALGLRIAIIYGYDHYNIEEVEIPANLKLHQNVGKSGYGK